MNTQQRLLHDIVGVGGRNAPRDETIQLVAHVIPRHALLRPRRHHVQHPGSQHAAEVGFAVVAPGFFARMRAEATRRS
jgi:hypothetical protein